MTLKLFYPDYSLNDPRTILWMAIMSKVIKEVKYGMSDKTDILIAVFPVAMDSQEVIKQ